MKKRYIRAAPNILKLHRVENLYRPSTSFQSPKKDRGGLSSTIEATDEISLRKYVLGVHEWLLCTTVEFLVNSQPQATNA